MKRVPCYMTEVTHAKLKHFSQKNFRTMQKSVLYVCRSYLENPKKFEFEGTREKRGRKRKILNIYMEEDLYNILAEIAESKGGNISRLVWFVVADFFQEYMVPVRKEELFFDRFF